LTSVLLVIPVGGARGCEHAVPDDRLRFGARLLWPPQVTKSEPGRHLLPEVSALSYRCRPRDLFCPRMPNGKPDIDLRYRIKAESLSGDEPTGPGALLTAPVGELGDEAEQGFREMLSGKMIDHISASQDWAITFIIRNAGNVSAEHVRVYAKTGTEGTVRGDPAFTSGVAKCNVFAGGDGLDFVKTECDKLEPGRSLEVSFVVSVPAVRRAEAETLASRALDPKIGLEKAVRLLLDMAKRLPCPGITLQISLSQSASGFAPVFVTDAFPSASAIAGRGASTVIEDHEASHNAQFEGVEPAARSSMTVAPGEPGVLASLTLAIPDDISLQDILDETVYTPAGFVTLPDQLDVTLFFPIDYRRPLDKSCPLSTR